MRISTTFRRASDSSVATCSTFPFPAFIHACQQTALAHSRAKLRSRCPGFRFCLQTRSCELAISVIGEIHEIPALIASFIRLSTQSDVNYAPKTDAAKPLAALLGDASTSPTSNRIAVFSVALRCVPKRLHGHSSRCPLKATADRPALGAYKPLCVKRVTDQPDAPAARSAPPTADRARLSRVLSQPACHWHSDYGGAGGASRQAAQRTVSRTQASTARQRDVL